MFVTFVMCLGLVRRLRLVNKAGQPPSGWDAIRRWLPKTTSHCQGILHHNWAQIFLQTFHLTNCTSTATDTHWALWGWTKWLLGDNFFCHEKLVNISLTLFPSEVTVQKGRAMAVFSTYCGRASMHVHSAPKTTTEKSSALVSREYR